MARELHARIMREFPVTEVATIGKFTLTPSLEQPRLRYIGPGFRKPTLEEIRRIAESTLLKVKHIYQLDTDLETIQGAGKEDIVLIPSYQEITKQAMHS